MKLIDGEGQGIDCASIGKKAFSALSEERLAMLQLLAKEAMYPAQLAREMGMNSQTLYYHIKRLQEAGLVKFTEYEEKRGAVAKKFACTSDSLAIVLNEKGWKQEGIKKRQAPGLFSHFVDNGHFNGKIVLGAPDPHGKYRARGSELCISELSMLLGQYASFSFPLYLLDTEVKEADKRQNLILAGGPKVNMLVAEMNSKLPITFDENNFDVYSKLSKKRYGENVGVIELINNPLLKQGKILLVGGLNHHGTRAAILGMIKKLPQIEKGNTYDPATIAKVVEGYDDNGDGIVDTVEILE